MDWLIERKLRRLGRRADPDRDFVLGLEKRLVQEIGVLPAPRAAYLRWASAAGLVLALGGATGAYAYASDSVLPGSALYPLKLEIENLEKSTSLTNARTAQVELKHLKRRLAEDEIIIRRDGKLPDERLASFHARLELSIEKVGESDADKHDRLDAMAAELAGKYSDLLDNPASTTAELAKREQAKLKARVDKLDEHRRKAYEKVKAKLERRRSETDGQR